jgi:Putative zinc-finger
MNCERARSLLSEFYDEELSGVDRAALERHLKTCPACAEELAGFHSLTQAMAFAPTPPAPEEMWDTLARSLEHTKSENSRTWPGISRALCERRVLLATAVSVLALATLWWLFRTEFGGHDHGSELAELNQYFDDFEGNPNRAQQVLLASYGGRPVALDEISDRVRFDTHIPERLPDDFKLENTYLLDMPCCVCVQALYRGIDGRRLAVFQHVPEKQSWFGDRPTVATQCCGIDTCLVQLGDTLAATWLNKERGLAVVGVRDLDELSKLLAAIESPLREPSPR